MIELNTIKLGFEVGHLGKSTAHLKYKWLACKGCQKKRWVRWIKDLPEREYCHPCAMKIKMRGSGNPNYKDGKRYFPNNGYVEVRVYEDDFFYPMADKNGFVYEHRLVMAKHLNRCLLPWEVVHHINGIKNDNKIENLELISSDKYHLVDKVVKHYIQKLEKENKELKLKLESHSKVNMIARSSPTS